MRERAIERRLVQEVKLRGGFCPKLTSPGTDGMPDRMVLLPGGHIGFVEVKAPGQKPRPLQIARHRILTQLGFKVYVLDDAGEIPRVIEEIGGTHEHGLRK